MIKRIENLFVIPEDQEVFNVNFVHFCTIRNGDLLGICNLVAFLRKREDRNNIKFHVTNDAMHDAEYCRKFKKFITENSDYLSDIPGEDLQIPFVPGLTGVKASNGRPYYISLWTVRGGIGDHVSIKVDKEKQKKICIFPVFDAGYNTGRNWNLDLTQEIIDKFEAPEFSEHQKYFCLSDKIALSENLDLKNFAKSHDYEDNLEHILTCSEYVGGDTGLTHFAFSLETSPKLYYFSNLTGYNYTLPFNITSKNCEMRLY